MSVFSSFPGVTSLLSRLSACLWLAGAATAAASVAASPPQGSVIAPDLHLSLSYHTINIGSDGVQREASYSRLMHRVGNRVWLEKEMPKALRESIAHGHRTATPAGPHAGHAHTLAQEAPIMIRREDDGAVKVQVVLHELEQLIDVERAHYGNVGYNGSWDATYHVIPPASLGGLQAVGRPRDGVQIYRRFEDESMTEVVWDTEKAYPIRVLRRGPHDMTYYLMRAEEVDAPEVLPWSGLERYGDGDYSDLLD